MYNDSRKPVITIVNPIRNALTDDVQFQVVARDGDGSDSNESGLSSFRVWVEYENASVRDTVDGAIKYDIVPKTEIWHDTQFTGAFPSVRERPTTRRASAQLRLASTRLGAPGRSRSAPAPSTASVMSPLSRSNTHSRTGCLRPMPFRPPPWS